MDVVAVLPPGMAPTPPPPITLATIASIAKRLWKLSGLAPDPEVTAKLRALHHAAQFAIKEAGELGATLYGPPPDTSVRDEGTLAALKAGAPVPCMVAEEGRRAEVLAQIDSIRTSCCALSREAIGLARGEVDRLSAAVKPKLDELEKVEREESEAVGLRYEPSPALRLQRQILSDLSAQIPDPSRLILYGINIAALTPWL
jgi:hypothetical protein